MARSDLLLSIVRAGATGDRATLRSSVEAVVAEERSKNHHILADRLQRALNAVTVAPPTTSQANSQSGKDTILKSTPRQRLEDLILPLPVSQQVRQLVEEQHRADLLRSHGIQPRHRVLLSGPPGNGKTSVAEAIAEALAVQFFTVRYDALVGSYLGETNTRLARLFDYARTIPCVLFFDEFDSIGKERGDIHETGEIKRVVSFLLMQIDQLPSYVVTVAATNHAELLDRAVWRRFQLRLAMPQPSHETLAVYLDRQFDAWRETTGMNAEALANKLGDVSFAEALEFCQTVRRQHILSLANRTLKDILREQVELWSTRAAPQEADATRSRKAPSSSKQPERSGTARLGAGRAQARQINRDTQLQAHGPIFRRLRNILDRQDAVLQLRTDPNSLAPERLLVFEVTGSVQNFVNAISRIAGLEFAGEEELEADDLDKNPEFYLLVPQLSALREIVSLWEQWERTGNVPRNYTPWRDLFLQLRGVRPWGPADRVSPRNRDYFRSIIDGAPDAEQIRIEIELVFRQTLAASQSAENDAAERIIGSAGLIVSRSLRTEFAYHALLVDVPTAEVRRIANLDPASLAGVHSIASIVPQSIGTPMEAADKLPVNAVRPVPAKPQPIAAVLDAVPVQAHPLLRDGLSVDDPNDLEARAVGARIHGTAMASLVLHGDLNDPPSSISRRVYFRPVMYAPPFGDELFDSDELIIDVIVEAIIRMRANGGQQVIVVNISLGDRTKPFSGKISTWARALDYLAFEYGILFLVSAGNIGDGIPLADFPDDAAFQGADPSDRASAVFRGLDAVKADRRVLAPADCVNGLTVGAWHRDSSQELFRGVTPFPPYIDLNMPNVSSRLGPGLRRGTKPDVLFAGGRERVRFDPLAASPTIRPHHLPNRFWGLKVAAPPQNGDMGLHFTVGTSAATALATHSAHRIFDALEEAYPQLIASMPLAERAVLLKALLVHTASWRGSENFIRPIVDPDSALNHEHWRREVCRHLGYGFVDPENAIACAGDRATLWATGTLARDAPLTFDVPIPAILAASAGLREVRATLAWFTPILPGHLAYRAVKLKIPSLEPPSLQAAGIGTTTGQPSNSQAESGTLIHRRWRDARIGDASVGNTIPVQVQRERDRGTPIDEAISFGLAVTIEMPGAIQVYDQVLAAIQVKPRIAVRAPA